MDTRPLALIVLDRAPAAQLVDSLPMAAKKTRDDLWSGTVGLMSALGQLKVVVFLTFFALTIGSAPLVIHTLVGNLLTPWLTSRMSPMAVAGLWLRACGGGTWASR